jgi:Protein of unknown function (DUF3892)
MAATAPRRIVCVETEHPHRHIMAVGIGDSAAKANYRMTVTEVREAIKDGNVFYTVGSSSGEVALVGLDTCHFPTCTVPTIRTDPDDAKDDNLDNMRVCQWKAA